MLVEAALSRVPFGRHKRVSFKAEDVEKSKTEEKRDGSQKTKPRQNGEALPAAWCPLVCDRRVAAWVHNIRDTSALRLACSDVLRISSKYGGDEEKGVRKPRIQ